jgi:hypothetical protein
MKVRDLREYTRALCKGHETIELLGTDKEEFLKIMNGQMKTVRGLITGAASFASNAEEQLFYEFVQNAYDANADSLFFYANKDYLIAHIMLEDWEIVMRKIGNNWKSILHTWTLRWVMIMAG